MGWDSHGDLGSECDAMQWMGYRGRVWVGKGRGLGEWLEFCCASLMYC
jgi:hypothetical protein